MALNFLLKRSGTASKRPVAASMSLGEIDLNYDATTGGLYYKDSSSNVVKVGPCQVSATAPNASPAGSAGNSQGEFWYDTSTSTLKVYSGASWVETGGAVQGITATTPITVDNTDPLNPVIGIDAATTTAAGAVQLEDSVTSTSVSLALTANQGKLLQDQIDALVISSNLTFAGTLDTSTGNLITVTSAGSTAGFTVGQPLPAAGVGNQDYFVIVEVAAASYTPPGGSAVETHIGDWFLSENSAWQFLNVGFQAPAASDTVAGVVELATNAETQTGTDATRAVTPAGLQSKVSDSVSTTSSTTIASSTAVKTAYDAAVLAQTDATNALSDAAAAQATADAAMPKSGGTFTGNVTFDNTAANSVEGSFTFENGSSLELSAGSTANVNSSAVLNILGQIVVDAGGMADFVAGSAINFYESPYWDTGVVAAPALNVSYDNTASGLTAIDVQGAIDELAALPSPIASYTSNKALTSGTPVNLLEWDTGVRMGTLVVMATDNSTNHAWANASIGADTGVGTSVVTTQSTGVGTFAIVAGGGGETIVEFTPSVTLASVDFVFQYTAAFGAQPSVL